MNLQRPLGLIGTLSIAIALFSISGVHWAILQGIAWGSMIQSYSSQSSLFSAVEKTFSGKYRCSLCKKIEQAKRQEKKKYFLNESFKKKEAILEQLFFFSKIFPDSLKFFTPKKDLYAGLTIRPLLEPPRVA